MLYALRSYSFNLSHLCPSESCSPHPLRVRRFPAVPGCPRPRLLLTHNQLGAEVSRCYGRTVSDALMAWLQLDNLNPTNIYRFEQVIVLLSCVLSFLGSLLIIYTHIRWPALRTRPRQLLLFLSVADLLSAAAYFYGVLRDFEGTTWDCVAQGAISTFSNTSSFFWTVSVAVYLHMTIVHSQQNLAEHMIYCFHFISWGVPLLITATAVSLQKIGYDASYVSVGWCWVNINADDKILWMLLTGKVWEILAYLILPVLYILIKKHIGRAHEALSEYRPILSPAPVQQPRATADMKLIFIPIIFIALRIWSTIRFILTLSGSTAVHNPVLVILHGIGNTFQGGANCIMFVLCTSKIRSRLVRTWCSCCRISCSQDNSEIRRQESDYGSTA